MRNNSNIFGLIHKMEYYRAVKKKDRSALISIMISKICLGKKNFKKIQNNGCSMLNFV